jgi:hypothetical protein
MILTRPLPLFDLYDDTQICSSSTQGLLEERDTCTESLCKQQIVVIGHGAQEFKFYQNQCILQCSICILIEVSYLLLCNFFRNTYIDF